MTPTESLKHEHRIILAVLDAAEREADSIRGTGRIHGDEVRKMLDFVRSFADRCHHAKEEKLLFPKMEERGMSTETGPLAVMLHEHELGRGYVHDIAEAFSPAEAGDPAAARKVADALAAYAGLLRSHIFKEDNVLYPMADNLLTPRDQEELNAQFDRVETEEMGEGVHEKYHALAHELAHK